jgi:protease I
VGGRASSIAEAPLARRPGVDTLASDAVSDRLASVCRRNTSMPTDHPLTGRRFLMFVDDVYEDLELWYPKLRLIEAGAEVVVAGPQRGRQYSGKHGYPCVADAAIAEQSADGFHGLVIPGGFAPDKLRRDRQVLALVQATAAAGKLVAAICHGGWIPISAGVYRGVRVTGSPGIRDDLVNAGAVWEDAPVVVDRHFISSRKPDDLPDFCRAIVQFLSR